MMVFILSTVHPSRDKTSPGQQTCFVKKSLFLYQLCLWYWTQILFFVKNTQNPRSFWLKSALNLLNILNFVFLTKIVRTRKVLEIFMKNTRKSWPSDKTVRVIRRKTLFSKKRFSLVAFKSSRKHYFFFKKIKIFTFSWKKVFWAS